jgi:hypothetical protein
MHKRDYAAQDLPDGFPVHDEDVTRLSPFVRHHINMLGRYSFELPELPGGLRPLRGPDADDPAGTGDGNAAG